MPGSMPMTDDPVFTIAEPLTCTATEALTSDFCFATRAVRILVVEAGARRWRSLWPKSSRPQERSMTAYARALAGGGGDRTMGGGGGGGGAGSATMAGAGASAFAGSAAE